jgi:anti-sigma regulatory factor (Ser/Thr protein kinase)
VPAGLPAGAGGEMAARIAAFDWSRTPLGPVPEWPQSLRTAVGICLSSRYPMVIWWGPELILLYNDAWVPILGPVKHPALGQPGARVWPEMWHIIGGQLSSVLATGEATWSDDQLLPAMRSGYLEEAYFTYSCSAIRDESGAVSGVFTAATETTQRVLGERRLRTLRALGDVTAVVAGTGHAAAAGQVCRAALRALSGDRADVPFAGAYVLDPDGTSARLAAAMGLRDDAEMLPPVLPAPGADPVLWEAAATGEPRAARGLAKLCREAVLPGASPAGETPCDRALALPVLLPGEDRPAGLLVAGVTPYRELDEDYRAFFDLVTGQLSRAVSEAGAFEARRRRAGALAELDRTRAVALTLQQAILAPTRLPPGFAARYTPAVAPLEVGGDWYDVIPLPGNRIGVVVGDCVGRGLVAAAIMGQLRSASQALLLRTPGPAEALADLDTFAARLPGAECATVVCAVIDPVAGTVTYSSAGHPPPILVSADGPAMLLDQAQSPPLAMLPATWRRRQAATALPPGASLMLYTDGLVERRGRGIDQGIEAAAGALAGYGAEYPDTAADHVMAVMTPAAGYEDDVAVVLYRHPPAPLTVRVTAGDPVSLALIRAKLRTWLSSAGVGRQLGTDILIAAGEATANAYEHAPAGRADGDGRDGRPGRAEPVRITLTARAAHDTVELTVTDTGSWRPPPPDRSDPGPGTRGHGIIFMHALMDDVVISSAEHGTTVTMTKNLEP